MSSDGCKQAAVVGAVAGIIPAVAEKTTTKQQRQRVSTLWTLVVY